MFTIEDLGLIFTFVGVVRKMFSMCYLSRHCVCVYLYISTVMKEMNGTRIWWTLLFWNSRQLVKAAMTSVHVEIPTLRAPHLHSSIEKEVLSISVRNHYT